MAMHNANLYPKLLNSMGSGLVEKGTPDAEPCLGLDTMLNLTVHAEVGGAKYGGFTCNPAMASDRRWSSIGDKTKSQRLLRRLFIRLIMLD